MAALSTNLLAAVGVNVSTVNTLTASDTLTYDSTRSQILVLRNGTAGALTVNILGNTATSIPVAGLGSVSVAAGYSTGVIGVGVTVTIALNTISAFLSGTSVTITGGTGISSTLYSL